MTYYSSNLTLASSLSFSTARLVCWCRCRYGLFIFELFRVLVPEEVEVQAVLSAVVKNDAVPSEGSTHVLSSYHDIGS
ncbi:unnamed protein product [Acanthoscelides obtectus]|uniref:Uncharacterized protein n=1 Tax=Acanthoscelides obtectus TaxID=200917 RepID=A0A9P0MEL2_ACAOB|nr:unnamed protein product [Acanthoscelides obtectus]CAK1670927.1 hypothetical protein AOBTE_LOCUS27925 [Acanthoscelides obtectus]